MTGLYIIAKNWKSFKCPSRDDKLAETIVHQHNRIPRSSEAISGMPHEVEKKQDWTVCTVCCHLANERNANTYDYLPNMAYRVKNSKWLNHKLYKVKGVKKEQGRRKTIHIIIKLN